MTLSVLVPGVPSRLESGMPPVLVSLFRQASGRNDVEILYLVDNKTRTIGAKRTALMHLARGAYVIQVDDDDEVSSDYVERLAEAAVRGAADVIVFPIRVTLDGSQEGIIESSLREPTQEKFKPGEVTRRRPCQRSCWRRKLVIDIPFPDTPYGEDYAWGDLACAQAQKEERIDAVLYHYKYDSSTSEAKP